MVFTNSLGTGLEKRKLNQTDFGFSTGTGERALAWDYTTLAFSETPISTAVTANSIAKRVSGGALYVGNATINAHAINLGQANSLYQPLDDDLISIAGLSATTGILRKTSENTWSLGGLVGSDFTTPGTGARIFAWNTDSWSSYSLVGGSATAGSIPLRTTNGRLVAGDAINPNEAYTFGQATTALALKADESSVIKTNNSGSAVTNYTLLDANTVSGTSIIYITTGTNVPVNGGLLQTNIYSTGGTQMYQRFAVEDAFYYRNKTTGTWSTTWYRIASREWIGSNYTTTTAMNAALALKADDNAVVKLTTNQTIAGTKTFSSSPIIPDAVNLNHAVNFGQLQSATSTAWTNGIAVYTLLNDAEWTGDGSVLLDLNLAIVESVWTGAYGWEIWWNEGTAGTTYKRSLDHYLGKGITLNGGNRITGGGFSLSLNVSSSFTIPAGAKLIIKKQP